MVFNIDTTDSTSSLIRLSWATTSVIVLAIYHYFITLYEEVHIYWSRRITGATIIYLANRYVVLSSAFVLCIEAYAHSDSDHFCKAATSLAATLLQCAQLIQGIFATLRVYVIRDQSKLPSLAIFALYLAAFVIRMAWIIPSEAAAVPSYMGCAVFHSDEYLKTALASRVLLMAADTSLVVLTWLKTSSIRRQVARLDFNLPFATLLFRDGTVCFTVNFLLGALDLVFIVSGNLSLASAASPYIIVLRSFVVSNFLVNLRQVYFGRDDEDQGQHSMVRFAATCVGNLGAPLTLPAAFEDHAEVQPHRSTDPLASGLIRGGICQESYLVACCSNLRP